MAPKRRERVAPPPGPDEWEVRYGTNEAARGWEDVCAQATGNALRAWQVLRSHPRPSRPDHRQHRLKGALGTKDGLEVWQLEVTGGGRLWYRIDDGRQTVWLDVATLGHPKETD
ncbi:hypothetical protein BKA15_000758 [Microlunatus parietis]|uniref:Type II toxin-antitoxin system RelE/ParE family toxin n=1 Tax=Microlunatus parietis TaxID=682979 RepID=A0A7Y9I394_9ACTN|nr:hypothetical protein [Microlunatus parietis]